MEHHIAYELGYRPVEDADALRFGSLIHLGLEQLWLGNGIVAALDVACPGAADAFEAVRIAVLLIGYAARWHDDDLSDVVAVEAEFRAPLVDPDTGAVCTTHELGGKMDVLRRASFVEHKTSSEDIGAGSFYWRRLRLNSQVSTYYAGARAMGHEPSSCLYDVIRKPALRPVLVPLRDERDYKIVLDAAGERVYCKTAKKGEQPKPRETGDAEKGYVVQSRPETAEEYFDRLFAHVAADPAHYYARQEIVRLEHEEIEAQRDAWQRAQIIAENDRRGRHPRNPDACLRYNRVCSYFDVCTGVASLEDPSRFVRLENVHAELTADAAE
jgi:hypothetical protein